MSFKNKLIPTQISQSKPDESRSQQGNDNLQISNVNKQDLLIGMEKELLKSEEPTGSIHNTPNVPNLDQNIFADNYQGSSSQAVSSKPANEPSHKVDTIFKQESETEVTFDVQPLKSLQAEEREGLRPISVELIPQNNRLRSSFHNLVIIPISED